MGGDGDGDGESARKEKKSHWESEVGGVPTALSFKLHCVGRAAPEAAGDAAAIDQRRTRRRAGQ